MASNFAGYQFTNPGQSNAHCCPAHRSCRYRDWIAALAQRNNWSRHCYVRPLRTRNNALTPCSNRAAARPAPSCTQPSSHRMGKLRIDGRCSCSNGARLPPPIAEGGLPCNCTAPDKCQSCVAKLDRTNRACAGTGISEPHRSTSSRTLRDDSHSSREAILPPVASGPTQRSNCGDCHCRLGRSTAATSPCLDQT